MRAPHNTLSEGRWRISAPSARPRDRRGRRPEPKATSASAMTAPGYNLAGVGALVRPQHAGRQVHARRARGTVEIGLKPARATMTVGRLPRTACMVGGGSGAHPPRARSRRVRPGRQGRPVRSRHRFRLLDGLDRHECGGQACVKRSRAVTCVPSPTGTPKPILNDAMMNCHRVLRLDRPAAGRCQPDGCARSLAQGVLVGGRRPPQSGAQCRPR